VCSDKEFGSEGIDTIADRFVAAETADFYWDGRIAEMPPGPYFGAVNEGEERLERVVIVGYFRSRYYVATCLVDGEKRVVGCCGSTISTTSRAQRRHSGRRPECPS
jgi:hypothetical protein